jgi:CheY-like chemotaxis protein
MVHHAPSAFSHLHVLVVEDESIICEALCMGLEHLGVGSVASAPNGRKALKQLAAPGRHPDLILLDIYMPEMDGIEFLSALRSSGYTGAVALMSGVNIEMLDLTRGMATDLGYRVLGAVEKPVPLEALEVFLKQL